MSRWNVVEEKYKVSQPVDILKFKSELLLVILMYSTWINVFCYLLWFISNLAAVNLKWLHLTFLAKMDCGNKGFRDVKGTQCWHSWMNPINHKLCLIFWLHGNKYWFPVKWCRCVLGLKQNSKFNLQICKVVTTKNIKSWIYCKLFLPWQFSSQNGSVGAHTFHLLILIWLRFSPRWIFPSNVNEDGQLSTLTSRKTFIFAFTHAHEGFEIELFFFFLLLSLVSFRTVPTEKCDSGLWLTGVQRVIIEDWWTGLCDRRQLLFCF